MARAAKSVPQHHMVTRVTAAQGVVRAWKGQAFVWGSSDCGRLAAAGLRALGVNPRISRLGRYSSEAGLKRALAALGFDSPEAYMDSLGLMRIAPAAALPGDIVGLPGEPAGEWTALTMALGNGRVLGFYEGVCHVLQPRAYVCAWRVTPKAVAAPEPDLRSSRPQADSATETRSSRPQADSATETRSSRPQADSATGNP